MEGEGEGGREERGSSFALVLIFFFVVVLASLVFFLAAEYRKIFEKRAVLSLFFNFEIDVCGPL